MMLALITIIIALNYYRTVEVKFQKLTANHCCYIYLFKIYLKHADFRQNKTSNFFE